MARLSAGSGYRYLLRNTAVGDAEQSSTTPLTDYYAASGNPPGRWVGAGLAGLATGGGLPVGSRVSEEPLRRVFAGRDPVTGAKLGRGFPTYSDHEGGKPRHAVAGFDLTFSVPKSVSVLWALAEPDTQARIVKAHREAVNEVLAFVERRVLVTRTGHGGVGQMATRGLVAASFDHWDTRSGDPNLHTHVVVANRVQGVDGAWRALDGRLLHKAAVAVSELYDDLLADRVAANLPVSWSYRDRGPRRTPAYELDGLEDRLLAEFSTRSADVTARTRLLASQFRGEHGRAPTRVERTRLAQRATRETRPPKSVHPLRDLLVDWRQRARLLTGREPLDLARAALAGEYARPLRSLDVGPETMLAIAHQVVSGVQARRSTWDVWNLHAEASRATRTLRMKDAGERLRLTDQVVAAAVTQCVALDPPGTSYAPTVARQGQGAVYTSPAILDAERALLAANHATDGPTMSAATAERIASGPSPQLRPTRTRHDLLAADQAAAVIEIATSGRRVDVLVGPAGAGKTVTLAVLRLAWESGHGLGSVMGLAPSAAAAGELAEALRLTCETTAKWLWETSGPGAEARTQAAAQLTERSAAAAAAGDGQEARRCSVAAAQLQHEQNQWRWHPGQLVIVDEAAMTGTVELAALAAQADQVGAKILLVGDHHQLGSVTAGGAFGLLARRGHGASLTGLWRFSQRWEANATRQLRRGDPACLAGYAQHDRVRGGDHDEMIEAAHTAWAADRSAGRESLLVAADNDTVTRLNERAHTAALRDGRVQPGGVALADGTSAGVGDLVITRENRRRLPTEDGGWVRNGDHWQIDEVHRDGAVTVSGHGREASAGRVRLPADYVADHLQLGYAVTAHRAQGLTVDTSHVIATPTMTRSALYVAMSRGRDSNAVYVVTADPDPDHEEHLRTGTAPPTPADVLERILAADGAQPSATEQLQQHLVDAGLPGLVRQSPPGPPSSSAPGPDRPLTHGITR